MTKRFLLVMAAGLVLPACGGGTNLDDGTIEVTTSALSLASVAPKSVVSFTFDGCCNAHWSLVGSGSSWQALSDNFTGSYISAPKMGTYPYYAGKAFEIDLSTLPNGAHVSGITVTVYARTTSPLYNGNLAGKISYWGLNTGGYSYFLSPTGADSITVPAGLFNGSSFQTIVIQTARSVSAPPSTTTKTSSSRMGLVLFGDNVQIAELRVNLQYFISSAP